MRPSILRPPVVEQMVLGFGNQSSPGRCALCGQSIRRGQGVTVRGSYRFGVCIMSLHRPCRSGLGEEAISDIVRRREEQIARRLGAEDSVCGMVRPRCAS